MSQPARSTSSHTDSHATTSVASADTILVPNSQTSDATSSSSQTFPSGPQSSNTDGSQDSFSNPGMSTRIGTTNEKNGQKKATVNTKSETIESIPRATSPNDNKDDSSISSSSSRGSESPGHGSKRTASGAVKVVNTKVDSVSLGNVRNGPFVRKSSAESRGSKISELSLQLKTRLTYAMIKVKNGWEQHSIDEVESLAASQLSSPMSTTSTMLRSDLQSPRTAMAGINGRLQDPMSTTNSRYRSSSSSRPGTANSAWPQYSPQLYERFPVAPTPTLAPAPDLYTKTRHQRSDSKLSTATTATRTMRATTPTPQEQDAVDTLLFMSSPANSSRFTHAPTTTTTQNSPSRNQFAIPRRAVGTTGPPTLYDRASASSEDEVVLLSTSASASAKRGVGSGAADAQRQAKRRSYGRLETERDVDRLLDSMRKSVSSSDDDAGIAAAAVAAGVRVAAARGGRGGAGTQGGPGTGAGGRGLNAVDVRM